MGNKRTGLVHLYTGDGKGKTTAALGLALRASGQGLRVAVLQFMKANSRCGEHRFVERFPAFRIVTTGQRSSLRQTPEEQRADAQRAMETARSMVTSGDYDLLVLDEVVTALGRGLLEEAQVLALVADKPAGLELVLTGRGATPGLIAVADLVTEMRKVKHPLDRGIRARQGVEY